MIGKGIARYFKRNNGEGNFAILDGPPGSGKTNFTCVIMEPLIKDYNFNVITNIKFNEKAIKTLPNTQQKIYQKIHYAPKYSDFLKAFVKIKGKSVTMIDDAQVTMGSSKMSTSKKGKYNDSFAMYIRKFNSNLWYVSHIEAYIPRYIYSQPHLFIEKPTQKDIIVHSETYTDVPKTNLLMETYHPPSWEYDVNINILLNKLSQVSQDKIKTAIKEFLKEDQNNQLHLTKSDQVKVILEFLGDDLGKTYKQSEIARRLGVSRNHISRIKKNLTIYKECVRKG